MRRFPLRAWAVIALGALAGSGALGSAVEAAANANNSGAAAPAAPHHATVNGTIHRIPKASTDIGIDGVLDEAAWDEALTLELPYEVWPADSEPAEVRTEALLTYGTSHFYAAFRAHDPDPSTIRARISDRDNAFQDDFVGVVLDTFNDERRAFEFFVNAMGVQMDLVQDDLNGREDSSWDAIWDSAGQLTDEGYVVELAIPYTSLRFQNADGDQIWGLDLIRIYPRDQRYLFAMNKRDKDRSCYLCQVSKVVGFEGATPGKNLEVTPTFTAVRQDRNEDLVNSVFDSDATRRDIDEALERGVERGSPDYDPGLTVKWGMTPNLTLSGTVNPDFSQVEADSAQLGVNEQFALFFPEKRPFFLEGADFFQTPLRAVHTRAVASPDWGAKVSGKEGKHAIGTFVARDGEPGLLIIPGSQGSDATLFEEDVQILDGVFRYRHDVGRNSAIGGLMTARSGDDYQNIVLGADALIRPADSDRIRLQFLGSQTQYPLEIAKDFDQSEDAFTDTAFRATYSHSTKHWGAWGGYNDFGPGFRADMGFMPQVGIKEGWVGGDWRRFGTDETWWSRMWLGADYQQKVDENGDLLQRTVSSWWNVSGPKRSFLFVGGGHRDFGWRSSRFDQPYVNAFYEIWPTGNLLFEVSTGITKRVDFAFDDPRDDGLARQGDEFRISPEIRWNLGRRLRVDLEHELRQLRLDEGEAFEANLTELRLAFQLNIRTFFRAVIQYRDVERDIELYPDCNANIAGASGPEECGLEPEFKDLFTQLLFSYKVNPQTAIFVGYTESKFDVVELDSLETRDRTLFFKVGYAWVQ